MADTPDQSETPRERPAHWAHPVDERGRAARARRARRRRIVLLLIVLVVGAGAGTILYLTSDERVEQFAETYLENLLGTHVSIGQASFGLSRGLVLEDLVVAAPAPFREPILTATQVNLKVDPLSLLRMAPEVSEIAVRQPRITLVLWNEEEWNFQSLIRSRPTGAVAPAIRPVVALDEGVLRVVRKIGGQTVYEHGIQVSGLLLPSEADQRTFRFQTDLRSREVHLAVASGFLDARSGALQFEGHASNVVLSERLHHSLPNEVQTIWDRFNPNGTINAKLLFDEKEGFRLVAELTGVEFDYLYGNLTHRFENLTGRCTFEPSRLTMDGVQGLMNGWPITLDGEVSGFDGERLGLALEVSGEHVDFAEGRPFLEGLAPHIGGLYRAYSPEGRADIDLHIERASGPGAALQVSGDLTCRDMAVTYHLFPYRIEGLRGTIHFSPEGYTTDEVVGRHGPSVVRFQGWATAPGPKSEAVVRVHGERIALDDDLRAALGERQRRVYDLYRPSGIADMDAEVHHWGGENRRVEVTTHLSLLDCGFTYEHFPYALEHTTGEVVIAPGRTDIIDVAGHHGDATILLEGELVGQPDENPTIRLSVSGQNVALDEDLEKALPEGQRNTLRAFHLSGLADFEGTVTRSPETGGDLDYDMAIHLKGARMIYEAFPFLAEEVIGEVRLTRDACRIGSLTGFNSGARIEATGWIDHRPDDYAMDLRLKGEDVALGESLRGALGPAIRSAWSHLSPRGRVDVDAHLSKAFGPDQTVDHHVWVTMRDAQATLDVFPYPLQHVTGRMEFVGDEARLHDLKARTGLTRFTIGGVIGYDDHGPLLDLAIRADGLRFEGPLRDALPAPLKKAFAVLKPTGRLDLNLERLRYRHDDAGEGRADWRGTAVLDEVGASPGVTISGIVGTAEMHGEWTASTMALEGQLAIQQGEVADKAFRDAQMGLVKSAASDAVGIRDIEGTFYGGRIEGFAAIGLKPGGSYALNLSATDVDFERLLREGFRLEHNISGGRLRGTMGLRAVRGNLEASGYLQVADAELYELPLVVRLFNVFRMAPAERTAFQSARVLYFLRNKRLILGDIRLEGRAMNLYGAGVMEPDGQLHLTFLTGKKNDDPLLPALSQLMEGLRKQLVVVLVTGTLAEPQVEFRTLSAVTGPIRDAVELFRTQRARRGPD